MPSIVEPDLPVAPSPLQQPVEPVPPPVSPREIETPQPAPVPAPAIAEPRSPSPAPVPPPVVAAVAPPAAPEPPAVEPAPAVSEAVQSAPRFDAAYLRNPTPVYPTLSRHRGEEGLVLLRVYVTTRGDPATVDVKTSSGFARLDRAAREAVQRWKFTPARRGEEPVDAWVVVPIRFSLREHS
jgi:protein TonB